MCSSLSGEGWERKGKRASWAERWIFFFFLSIGYFDFEKLINIQGNMSSGKLNT